MRETESEDVHRRRIRSCRGHGVRARWMCIAVVVLGGCSPALMEYEANVPRSSDTERPLIEARRCLENYGFEVELVDGANGLVWGEKAEYSGDGSSSIVISEVAVMRSRDGVTIVARSKEGSPLSGGWDRVRVSEQIQETVDRIADHLDARPARIGKRCMRLLSFPGERNAIRSSAPRVPTQVSKSRPRVDAWTR